MEIAPRIAVDFQAHSGKPVTDGTRVPVSVVAVAAGDSIDEVARECGVTPEDMRAALSYATQQAGDG